MSCSEKCSLLNQVIAPFGYQYLPCEDIFYSVFHAWQRDFGYTSRYDRSAPYFNMVFDSEPVYFDYKERTWLIEIWKGQYGINSGSEIGIYCADAIIPPCQREKTLFHTVPDEELPVFSMKLYRETVTGEEEIANLSMTHWWLAAFRMGWFSWPEELFAELCIQFPDCKMMHAFADAIVRLGYHNYALKTCCSSICFAFDAPLTPASCGLRIRLVRRIAQWENQLYCRLFLFVTRPFCSSLDRLLFLYFYLPFIFRRCMRLHRRRKSHGRKKEVPNEL